MKNYKHILVPMDDSEQAQLAFKKAVLFLKLNHGRITVIQVVDDSAYSMPAKSPLLEELLAVEEKQVKAHMKERKEYMIRNGISDFDIEIITGNPKKAIQNYVRQYEDTDLIVMGATGMGSPYRVDNGTGSTTGYVVDHVTCSVFVVR